MKHRQTQNITVYSVSIAANLISAVSTVRFPCLFFVQWKTNNQKKYVQSGRCSGQKGKVQFNEKLILKTNIGYDKIKKWFLKRQSLIQLNLLSKGHPDEPKLVGRTTIDIANILNERMYENESQFQLQFCSVNASIILSFSVLQKQITDLQFNDIERSYNQSVSMNSGIKNNLSHILSQKVKDYNPQKLNMLSQKSTIKKQINRSLIQHIENGAVIEQAAIMPNTPISQCKTIKNQQQLGRKPRRSMKLSQQLIEANEGQMLRERSLSNLMKDKKQKILTLSQGFNEQFQGLKQELQRYKSYLDLSKIDLKMKQQQIMKANLQNDLLKKEISKKREQTQKNRQQILDLTLQLSQVKQIHNKALMKMAVYENQLHKKQKGKTFNDRNNQQMNEKVKNAQSQLQIANKKCNQLQQYKLSLQKELNDVKQLYHSIQYQLTANQNDLSQKLKTLQQQITNLKKDINLKNRQIQEKNHDFLQLSSEYRQIHAQLINYQQKSNQQHISKQSQSKDNQNKKNKIKQLQARQLEMSNRIGWLQAENLLLNNNNKHIRQTMMNIEGSNSTLLQQKEKQISSLQQKIKQLQMMVQQMLIGTNSQKQELQSLRSQNRTLRQQNINFGDMLIKNECMLGQGQQKNRELQQMILILTRQKNILKQQWLNNERKLNNQAAQILGQNKKLNQMYLKQVQTLLIANSQIQRRQHLIHKLQEALQINMARSEELNQKLIKNVEKQIKNKDNYQILSTYVQQINEMIAFQQQNQYQNQSKLSQNLQFISDLQQSIEQKQHYIHQLTYSYNIKQSQKDATIKKLELQINEKADKITQNATMIHILRGQNEKYMKMALNMRQQLNKAHEECSFLQSQLKHMTDEVKQYLAKMQAFQTERLLKQQEVSVYKLRVQQYQLKQLQNQSTILNNQLQIKHLEGSAQQHQKSNLNLIHQKDLKIEQLLGTIQLMKQSLVISNIQQHNLKLKQKCLQNENLLKQNERLNAQANKMIQLQRSLKIKSIQLNTYKLKGSKEGNSEIVELIRYKDEQISLLKKERDRLAKDNAQVELLKEKIDSLMIQQELMQQQKFSIESQSNEKKVIIQQLRQQNKKLLQEITIIGQRNNYLEKQLFQQANSAKSNGKVGSQKNVIKKVLFNSEIAGQTKIPINNAGCDGKMMNEICKQIKLAIKSRQSDKTLQRLREIVELNADTLRLQDNKIMEKLLIISKQFQKIKVQILKGQYKNNQQKIKNINIIQNYDQLLKSVLAITQFKTI